MGTYDYPFQDIDTVLNRVLHRRPSVGDLISRGPWIVRIEHELMCSGDPGPARNGRHDRPDGTHRGQRVDAALELGADDRPRPIAAPDLHPSLCMQYRHPRRTARAGW